MNTAYDMIFKRKSMRKFDPDLHVSREELDAIEHQFTQLVPLFESVPVALRIVESGQTTSRRGEYCLLLYSEKSERSYLNTGYLLEQMDLFLTAMDIGVCWHGIGKPDDKQHKGLSYIIMLAFGKSRPEDFRQDVTKAARKPGELIWQGGFDFAGIDAARYAPSACNMQPWRVQGDGQTLTVFRTKDVHSAIMPPPLRPFFNTIDLGIFLCFLELTLSQQDRAFTRSLLLGETNGDGDKRLIPIARYTLAAT